RDASTSDKEVSVQYTGSIELATLSTMVIDDTETVFNKQKKVAQTYSQPQVESDDRGDSNTSSSSAKPVLDSEA
ncbi:MAG: hypothetical protein HN996_02045, partial [Opitutae bacterium]|nr:hypothetical protein [Opitutae bacterium]